MDLYSSMFTRKSTRNFNMKPLSETTLKEVETFIETVQPLLPNAEITYKLVGPEGVKGIGTPKAPHYLLIYGKEQHYEIPVPVFYFNMSICFYFLKAMHPGGWE